jgi:hypothetical protein
MRRDFGLHARFLLPALLTLAFVGCGSAAVATFSLAPGASCACATQPGPTGTPPPVTSAEATTAAARIVQVPAKDTYLVNGPSNRLLWEVASADGTTAFVDAVTAEVPYVVVVDAMADHDVASIADTAARTAAEAFMSRFGQTSLDGTETTETIHRGGVAAIVVSWTDSGASPNGGRRVFVNAETGAVFAYVRSEPAFDPVVPIVGKARASELAMALINWPGMNVTSAEWTLYFSPDGSQVATWTVGMNQPSATQADVFIHGAVVSVDAGTGATTILKSDTGR